MGMPMTRGGPGTSSPGRIHYSNVTLMLLLMKAYGLHDDQVQGPGRLTSDRYMLDGIVPPGATAEQFQKMLQNLLLKRFRLAFRWEERDFRIYHLVLAEGGSKLKRSAVVERGDAEDDQSALVASLKLPPVDESGCPSLPLTRRGFSGRGGKGNCQTFVGYSMAELAEKLEFYVGAETATADFAHLSYAHVIDDTGLRGRFDFHFNYDPMSFLAKTAGFPAPANLKDRFPSSESIFKVVQSQLGLKLEATTSKLKRMSIQHIETDPGEN